MNIEWIKTDKYDSSITVYNNNITFRQNISKQFQDALGIAVGVNKEESLLIFKKITEANKKIIKDAELYKLDFKPSYARLNSKKVVELLNSLVSGETNSSCRYKASWDEKEEMLLVYTKEKCDE